MGFADSSLSLFTLKTSAMLILQSKLTKQAFVRECSLTSPVATAQGAMLEDQLLEMLPEKKDS